MNHFRWQGKFYRLEDEDVRQHVFLIAQLWQLLVEGKRIRPSDTVFLRHELLELTIMREKGYTYEEAHELANQQYYWELDRSKEG